MAPQYQFLLCQSLLIGTSLQQSNFDYTATDPYIGEKQPVSNSQLIIFLIMAIFSLLVIISYIFARFVSKNDSYSLASLITACIYILDTLTDILFLINISNQPDYPSSMLSKLLISSVLFIVIPYIITRVQFYHQINKWNLHNNDNLHEWLSVNVKKLWTLSILLGSPFTATRLCTSNLFDLYAFDMPLNEVQMNNFQANRIYSTALFQNVPQLALQSTFIAHIGSGSIWSNNSMDIVFTSMVFSVISLIISISSLITRREILRAQHVSIECEVSGELNISGCRNNMRLLKNALSAAFDINSSSIKISRVIEQGIKGKIQIYINNKRQIDTDIIKVTDEMSKSGELMEIIKASCSLSTTPNISTTVIASPVICKEFAARAERIRSISVGIGMSEIEQPGNNTDEFSDDALVGMMEDENQEIKHSFIQDSEQLSASDDVIDEVEDIDTMNTNINLRKEVNEWNHKDIYQWILSLEDGLYEQYSDVLRKSLTEDDLHGSDLKDLDKNDIKGWGVLQFRHRHSLCNHIQELISNGNGSEGIQNVNIDTRYTI